MAFADDFSRCMSQWGVQVDPGTLPDRDALIAALEYMQRMILSLDEVSRAGIDAATSDDASSALFAQSDVNVAPAIPTLLDAFDRATGQPLSRLLEAALWCLNQEPQLEA